MYRNILNAVPDSSTSIFRNQTFPHSKRVCAAKHSLIIKSDHFKMAHTNIDWKIAYCLHNNRVERICPLIEWVRLRHSTVRVPRNCSVNSVCVGDLFAWGSQWGMFTFANVIWFSTPLLAITLQCLRMILFAPLDSTAWPRARDIRSEKNKEPH